MKNLFSNPRTIILWLIGCAFFMELLDSTALNSAVPQMALSLQQNPIHLKVALTSYLLSLGVFIPVSGWLADRFGTRNIFGSAMIVFLLGSIFCGFSTSLSMLTCARIIQGIGGAMMTPVARLIMLRTFPKSELVSVTSKIQLTTLIAPTLGPVIGGALTFYLSWRWIFFVNIPLGLAGCYFIFRFIKNDIVDSKKKFDWFGFILLGTSLAGFLIGLDSVTDPLFSSTFTQFILLLSVFLMFAYFLYARHRPLSVINISIFKAPHFSLTTFGNLLFRISTGGIPFLLPLIFQLEFGASALESGLLVAPMAFGMLLMKSQVKWIIQRFGFKNVLLFNVIIVSLLVMQLSWITTGLPAWAVIALLFIYGFFLSLYYSTVNALSYSLIPDTQTSNGASIISANMQISACFGIAIAALILEHFLHSKEITQIFSAHAFAYTLLSLGCLNLLTILIFYRLPPNISESAAKGHAP